MQYIFDCLLMQLYLLRNSDLSNFSFFNCYEVLTGLEMQLLQMNKKKQEDKNEWHDKKGDVA